MGARGLVDRLCGTTACKILPHKEKAQRFATDPEYRASLVTAEGVEEDEGGNERTGPHARALPVKRRLE
jgi:hypothetical protein